MENLKNFLHQRKGTILAFVLSILLVPIGYELLLKLSKWMVSFFGIKLLETQYITEILLTLNAIIICSATCLIIAKLSSRWRIALFIITGIVTTVIHSTKIIIIHMGRSLLEVEHGYNSSVVNFFVFSSPVISLVLILYLLRNADRINETIAQLIRNLRGEMNMVSPSKIEL